MTKPTCLLVVAALWFAGGSALADQADAVLIELLDAFLRGASVNDAAVHDRFWAEDLVYTSSSGARFGKAEIMAGLAASAQTAGPDAASGPVYSGREVQVRVFEDTAVITFQLVAEPADGPTERFYNTGVFRLIDDHWQAVVWQATRASD